MMPELDLAVYGADGVSSGTTRGRLARVGDRARTEAADRGVEITDMLTCPATDAATFVRGGWVVDSDGTRWQLVAPQRMPGASNASEARWQLNEEGAA